MDRLVRIALRIITALIIVATVVSFSESYHGLFEWAVSHQVPWFWALIWPLMLDLVILVGECTVFVAIHRHWKVTHRVWAWAVTYTGLAVSTLANGGHVTSRDWLTHITNAMPPVALMFALTVGLGVLKRTRMQPSVPLPHTLTERPVHTRSERLSQPLTEMVRTGRTETLSQPLTEPLTPPESPLSERAAPGLPETLEPTETFAGGDFRATEKSFTMPRDSRTGLKLPEQRVRDMFDLDPDISVNAIAKALGVHWKTGEKYLNATKEARGLPA